jgi:hypothetical protein
VERASGKYVLFLDDDAQAESGWLAAYRARPSDILWRRKGFPSEPLRIPLFTTAALWRFIA